MEALAARAQHADDEESLAGSRAIRRVPGGDRRAATRQPARDGSADAARAAGDQRHSPAATRARRRGAEALVISSAAVEKHITRIFGKLGIDSVDTEHRRVHAVLTYLRGS